MSEQLSALTEFSRSIWAKVVGALTVIMMMLGIYVELVTAWRGTNEALIAATNVQKTKDEADSAASLAVINKNNIQKSIADAAKAKADKCIARAEASAKNMRVSDVLDGTYSNEDLARDCDPNYARRQACAEKFKAIFAPIETFTLFDSRVSAFADTLGEKLSAYKDECAITEANKKYAAERYAALRKVLGLTASSEQPQPPPPSPEATRSAMVAPPPPGAASRKSDGSGHV